MRDHQFNSAEFADAVQQRRSSKRGYFVSDGPSEAKSQHRHVLPIPQKMQAGGPAKYKRGKLVCRSSPAFSIISNRRPPAVTMPGYRSPMLFLLLVQPTLQQKLHCAPSFAGLKS